MAATSTLDFFDFLMEVIIDDSTQDFSALDRACVVLKIVGDRNALPNPLMGAGNIVVVINIFEQNTL